MRLPSDARRLGTLVALAAVSALAGVGLCVPRDAPAAGLAVLAAAAGALVLAWRYGAVAGSAGVGGALALAGYRSAATEGGAAAWLGLEVAVLAVAAARCWRKDAAAAQERFRAVAERMAEPCVQLAASGRVAFCNAACAEAVGLTRAEVVGRNFFAWADPAPPGGEWLQTRHPGGPLRWRVVRLAGGGRVAVGQRPGAKGEGADEFQTQRLASLGVLAGGIAHDTNNLVAGILGQAELAARVLPPDAEAGSHLARIQEAALSCAELSRQLMGYAGSGQPGKPGPVALNDLVLGTLRLVALALPKGVAVRPELADGLPAVRGEAVLLRQVLMNLALNAGEAMAPKGEGALTIRTEWAAGRVRLTVADTGPGMDAATLARIFDPFFTTKPAGHGLGLSAVRRIVGAHDGTLDVASDPAAGTTFRLDFPPLAPEPVLPAVRPGAASDETAVTDQEFDTATDRPVALVVDDEEGVRALGQAMLVQLGWDVLTAEDGVEACGVFAQARDRIRLVLLDLRLPRRDGAETLAVIREIRPDVPVLFCTAYADDSDPDGDAPHGGDGWLPKPYRLADLRQAVSDAQAHARARRGNPGATAADAGRVH